MKTLPILAPIMIFLLTFFTLFLNVANAFDHTHQILQQLLDQKLVIKGEQSFVKYSEIKNNPEILNSYIKELSTVSSEEFKQWDSSQRLAFLINAYNALTLKMIVKNYPIKSIRDIGNFFTGNAWNQKFFHLLGRKSHLDDIEHTLIRKNFNEPRIHFALVCASNGCPNLQQKVFTAKDLESQLSNAAKDFLSNSLKNRFSSSEKKLYLSMIFKWYGDDFTKSHASYLSFIAPFLSSDLETQKKIANNSYQIEWIPYSWDLNDNGK